MRKKALSDIPPGKTRYRCLRPNKNNLDLKAYQEENNTHIQFKDLINKLLTIIPICKLSIYVFK